MLAVSYPDQFFEMLLEFLRVVLEELLRENVGLDLLLTARVEAG